MHGGARRCVFVRLTCRCRPHYLLNEGDEDMMTCTNRFASHMCQRCLHDLFDGCMPMDAHHLHPHVADKVSMFQARDCTALVAVMACGSVAHGRLITMTGIVPLIAAACHHVAGLSFTAKSLEAQYPRSPPCCTQASTCALRCWGPTPHCVNAHITSMCASSRTP